MSGRTEWWGDRHVADGGHDSSRNLGMERHRILRELQRELRRHPAVEAVQGVPDGRFRELRAVIDPSTFDRDAERASLRVTWWPAPGDPTFIFHYSDTTGLDCGWHREVNPHVDGKVHYQERQSPDSPYQYEEIDVPTLAPTRLCWTIFDRLADRLGDQ